MHASSTDKRRPRFCGNCGAELPSNSPRFCIECGQQVGGGSQGLDASAPTKDQPPVIASTGPTVRLGNARGEQTVVGGTVKLATSSAIPPGLWLLPKVPGPSDVIAIYAPLRAIVGGWSATTGDGWRKLGQAWAGGATSQDLVRFEITREWFAAPGCAEDARLCVRIGASAYADEGHTRRGFHYRAGADPPMEVIEAWWIDGKTRRRRGLPAPEVQIMAPPRALRVSDYPETIAQLSAREAELWSKAGAVQGVFRLDDARQQRTLAGRGILLLEVPGGTALMPLTGLLYRLHAVRIQHPLVVRAREWAKLEQRIQADAAALGLDLGTDAMVEWWLDRQGHDGVVLERGAHLGRTVVAFRRSQIAEIVG